MDTAKPALSIQDFVRNLFEYVSSGQVEALKLLLNINPSLASQVNDRDGWTLLHQAAHEGQVAIMELLISKNAPLNELNNNGFSPLTLAIHENKIDAVNLLIKYKADLNICNPISGETPLTTAAFYGFDDIVKALLENKVSPNKTDEGKSSPLSVAKNSQIALRLIKAGADVNASTEKGETALTYHKGWRYIGHKETLKHINEADSSKPYAVHYYKEYAGRKLISNTWTNNTKRITGESIISSTVQKTRDVKINYNGFSGPYVFHKIIKSVQIFSNQFPQLLPQKLSKGFCETLSYLEDNQKFDIEEQLKIYKSGNPIAAVVGYYGHQASVLIWNNYFVTCDGDVQVRYFDPTNLKDFLIKAKEIQKKTIEEYRLFMDKTVPSLLKLYRGPVNHSLEYTLTLETQLPFSSTLCTWANSTSLLAVYVALEKVVNKSASDDTLKSIDLTFYEDWVSFFLYRVLHKYIKLISKDGHCIIPDYNLLNLIFDKSNAPPKGLTIKAFLSKEWAKIQAQLSETLRKSSEWSKKFEKEITQLQKNLEESMKEETSTTDSLPMSKLQI